MLRRRRGRPSSARYRGWTRLPAVLARLLRGSWDLRRRFQRGGPFTVGPRRYHTLRRHHPVVTERGEVLGGRRRELGIDKVPDGDADPCLPVMRPDEVPVHGRTASCAEVIVDAVGDDVDSVVIDFQ